MSKVPHLALGATVPGAHGVAAVLPPGHAVPAGHAEQASADLSPWLPLYEPAGQGTLWALIDPTGQ